MPGEKRNRLRYFECPAAAGVTRVLTKPLQRDELARALSEVLR